MRGGEICYNEIGDIMELRAELAALADESYKNFQSRLIPNVDPARIFGVRIPKLRALAKTLETDDFGWDFYEEQMLHGLYIGYCGLPFEKRLQLLDDFVPRIDNWAVCDCAVSSMRFIKKDRAAFSRWLQGYMSSAREYELRFCVVVRMHAYLTDAYIDETLSYLRGLQSDFYYVQMAVAWALATAFVPYRERVLAILEAQTLQPAVQNRTIGKICDSLRVDAQDKQLVRQLRR